MTATYKYPMAKGFAILSGIVLFVGIMFESVKRSDLGDAIFALGLVGVVASVLLALDKKNSPKTGEPQNNEPSKPEQRNQKFGRQRFQPGAYTFDLSAVGQLPLQMNGKPSTFLEVYRRLRNSKIQEPEEFSEDEYVTEDGEVRLDGNIAEWPLRHTMRKLVDLRRKNIDPSAVTWFYYGHDWSIDADESYQFFAVHNNQIISDTVSFGSEEPLILKWTIDEAPVWHSHEYFSEAWESYWYRKFYTETMTGQLMVLRPDEPILYRFARPPVAPVRDLARELELFTLFKIHRLLWVIVPLLVAVVFPSVALFMAIIAGLAGLDVLRLAWMTPKISPNS